MPFHVPLQNVIPDPRPDAGASLNIDIPVDLFPPLYNAMALFSMANVTALFSPSA
jgi:hypothetical protein